LKGLLEALDQFFLSSTIGDYEARIKLLDDFRKFAKFLSKDFGMVKDQPKIVGIISNVHGYYIQFLPSVQEEIESLRKPILKELKEYVKIATWKDVNVFALKESAKRTHYHLNKFVKKFRIGLQMKSNEVILRFHEIPPNLPGQQLDLAFILDKFLGTQSRFISTSVLEQSQCTNLIHLHRFSSVGKLYERSKSITLNVMEESIALNTAKGMESIVNELVSQVKQFQKLNTSLQAGAPNAKGQKMIRKKLWVDFLKLLEFIGLNPRSTQKYARLQDRFHLYSRTTIDNDLLITSLKVILSGNHVSDILEKAESYYYRNLARLEAVRKLRINFSTDISKLEMDKSISFLDHLMFQSISQRHCLSKMAKLSWELECVATQFSDIGNFDCNWDKGDLKAFIDHSVSFLNRIIVRVEKSILILDAMNAHLPIRQQLLVFLTNALSELKMISIPTKTAVVLPSLNILDSIQKINMTFESMKAKLYRFRESDVAFAIFDLLNALNSYESIQFNSASSSHTEFELLLENATEKTLIVMQYLSKPEPHFEEDISMTNEFELSKGQAIASSDHLTSLFSGSVLPEWISTIVKLIAKATSISRENQYLSQNLSALFTIINQARLLLSYRVYQLIIFHKTWVKFSYFLSNNFYTIAKNGFCVPKLEEEDEEEDPENQTAGTGIGEGVGSKDVSKEIDDQEQVEGLKNEEQDAPDPEKKIKDEKEGVEMDDDFEGKMEDISDDEEDQDNSDPKENEDPEEQMGNVDQELADTVDEKMWGDNEEPKSGKDEKTEKDSSVEKGGQDETVAKENEEDGSQDGSKEKEDPEERKKGPEELPEHPDDQDEGPVNEAGNFEENHGVEVKDADDLDNDDEEMEDLPDNLEFDDDGEENDMDIDNSPDMPDDSKSESSEVMQDPEDNLVDPMPNEEPLFKEISSEDTAEEDIPPEEENLEEKDDNLDKDMEEEPQEDLQNEEQDRSHGYGEAEAQPELSETEEDDVIEEMNKPDQPNADAAGVEGDTGQQNILQASETQQEGEGNANTGENDQEDINDENGQQKSSISKEKESELPSRKTSSESNPHRSVGNAMDTWLSRLRNISDSINEDNEQTQEKPKEDVKGNDFEFVKEDDQDQGDDQAMGVADKEQIQKMEKLAIDAEKEEVLPVDEEEMELDDVVDDSALESKANSLKDLQNTNSSIKTNPENTENEDIEDIEDKGDKQEGDQKKRTAQDETSTEYFDPEGLEDDNDKVEIEDETYEIQDYDAFRMDLENRMAIWRQSGQNVKESQELWRNYAALTQNLAFSLCEQLRLILEPTLSTKLKGDFRNGKRLNMRKIIPYIASQFKKDKIWLRRTKPSKRTYQIMIAIDDSLSMASSHSVQLAFESLTVITTALNQLEAGDIAIVSFGEEVKLVHPFEKTWSDESGAQVLQSFTFSQQKTFVKILMDQSLEVLRHARIMQSSADLWQLEIILSDGICEDHAYIKNRVHLAAEEHIAMVFIILDTRSEKDSILNMNDVSYDLDPNTNMPILKMNRYMDSFPFDYYVLVRNVETLPEVLSDILRQFFMFISQ
jgi:midasin